MSNFAPIAQLNLSGGKSDVILVDSLGFLNKTENYLCIENCISDLFDLPSSIIMKGGEGIKNFSSLQNILNQFFDHNLTRYHRIVAVGGGAFCDIFACASNLYMRGIDLYLLPSTLLGMVDAAIGGKTGFNFRGHKNILGTFYPAQKIFIYPPFLLSLTDRNYKSGLAEIIKAALLGDEVLVDLLFQKRDALLNRDLDLLRSEILPRAIEVKVRIVQEDEKEKGVRSQLNLGHTFAHALEACSSDYTHGEAVGWGIGVALGLSEALGLCKPSYHRWVRKLLDLYSFPVRVPINSENLWEAMGYDKKRKDQRRFVLQKNQSQTDLYKVDKKKVITSLMPYLG